MFDYEMRRRQLRELGSSVRTKWHTLGRSAQHAALAVLVSGVGLLGVAFLPSVARPGVKQISSAGTFLGGSSFHRQSENLIDATTMDYIEIGGVEISTPPKPQSAGASSKASKAKRQSPRVASAKGRDKPKAIASNDKRKVRPRPEPQVSASSFEPAEVWSVSRLQ